ncbi:MAG TPA: O-antigen ligase family protein [Rhizomicrobium sp.]
MYIGDKGFWGDAGTAQGGFATYLATAGFVALLLLLFVTLHPFHPPPDLQQTGNIHDPAGGDALRQVCYLGAFALALAGAFGARGFGAIRALPLLLTLLLAWCLASASWAEDPAVVFRRAALASILVLSTFLSFEVLGATRAFQLLRAVLVGVLIVNWLSIPLIHTAVHLPGETDPGLVGDWRGLYSQKNTAGAICALTVLLFLFRDGALRRWTSILVIVAATGFLVMTHSKTSMVLLPVAILAGGLYRLAWGNGIDRASLFIGSALLVFLAVIFGLYNVSWLAHLLENPTQFTGRAEIWKADIAFLHDHFFLGAGFGTVAGTGGPSFLRNYVLDAWVQSIGDSHNGYLQLIVSLGVTGFVLALLALVGEPVLRFWPLDRSGASKAGLFALFIFVILHDFTESDFLESDSGAWFIFLLVIASLRERPAVLFSGAAAAPSGQAVDY